MVPLCPIIVFLVQLIPQVFPHPPYRGPWRPSMSEVVYYSEYPKTSAPKTSFLPKPQYCPETGRTVCENVPYYPSEYIFHLVAETKAVSFNFTSVFFDEHDGDSEPNMKLLPPDPKKVEQNSQTPHQQEINKRNRPIWSHYGYDRGYEIGYAPTYSHSYYHHRPLYSNECQSSSVHLYRRRRQKEEEPLCAIRTMFILPEAGLTDQSQWKFVVNIPDKDPRFKQVIRVDVCSAPNEACANKISLPPGYESRCKQKYSKKSLVTLDGDGQGTSQDQIFLPTCCVCQIVLIIQK
ncbi:uncharacterized protein LOC143251452 isoform X1 [Tachypleus tridentatus]|uniref:uncharacterized protein LOC143251452 isoform X1 n=1 Tax=Tachypleus tridentatus TaxID=6853 RepID=UPI003FD315A9